MIKLLRKIRVNKSGASAAEYALILAIVGGAISVAALSLSGAISGAMTKTATKITASAT